MLLCCSGQKVLEQTRLRVATAGIHCKTGLHYPEVEDTAASSSSSSSSSTSATAMSGSSSIKLAQAINILEMNGWLVGWLVGWSVWCLISVGTEGEEHMFDIVLMFLGW